MLGSNLRKSLGLIKRGWLDLLFVITLIVLIGLIVRLLYITPKDITSWLLVYLTAIYALLTLYMALVSVKSALASERSAKAMEDSLEEARKARWAQFAATISLPDGEFYDICPDGSAQLRLDNVFSQPIIRLTVVMWQTELNINNEREVRYSTMMKSEVRDVLANENSFVVTLHPAKEPESTCRTIGEMALSRFVEVYGKGPSNTLCLVFYYHRADLFSPNQFVYDLRPKTFQASETSCEP